MIFDTHAHYDDPAFDGDRDALLRSFPAAGIGHVTNVCCTLRSLKTTRELTEAWDFLYGAAGIHPESVGELSEETFSRVRETARLPKFVAVGEIGLDYYEKEAPDRETQKKWFRRQLDLARELGKPVVIHSREAAKDTLDILREARGGEIGGVIHCFSYSREMAREYLGLGFFLGIGGVSTYKNARRLLEVIRYAPMDRLVLETDSPYLAPEPHRGTRNSSLNLPLVVRAIAENRGMGAEEVEQQTWENARRLYRIS
ncbi:TatD family hydrolase [Clostridium vitabionis]|jgi:TatD DNase family protein|uniref:TatD family hydrolase n=1 Tax=Clostridium vitabionis TaxID=2784388 RepID=UPI00188ADA83|nr:TatD family hydrolase [Clostridium vitabionis]